ncbi:unnamed protein product [Psylliodes chrysocephalus]|uniref:Reverse transcriptase n=1 Tax=Psylliodes chrysocephalus TaxID=3402493 RepID=A0A9P0D5L3_9CUCU|nr:unnamed protein product [Psylliodes chrysocephala]
MCGEGNENIEHLISGCKTMAPKEYTTRHNNVAKIIHDEVCYKLQLSEAKTPYYKYTPDTIKENDEYKVYWDREIQTDRQVQHNRPDILINNKKTNEILLVDIAVPAPLNMQKKNKEKAEKYLPLAEDMKQTWNATSVRVVPIIVGATGEIPKNLKKQLEIINLPANTYLNLQKSVILSTCNIMRKILNQKSTP